MFIWLLALVLVGGFAALGFQTGAIRSLVSLLGVLLGLALASLVGGVLSPLVAKLTETNPLWLYGLPATLGFLLVWLVFFGAGFAAHKPVELHFKYRSDDVTRDQFEKMNKALGLFVGMLAGVILFFAAGKPMYSTGYLTAQTASETGELAPVKWVNQFRSDMTSSGWDRTFAALDATPAVRYQIADLLGFIHENPAVRARLLTYPPFLSLAEKPELTELLGDAEYLKLLDDKAGITALHNHPKTQAVLTSSDVRDALAKVDLKDLKSYLETGKSPLFDDEKILGRWRADVTPSIIDARRKRTNLPPAELRNLRAVLATFLKNATAVAYPDGRFVLTVPLPALPKAPETAADGSEAAAGTPALDPILAQRYGLRPGSPAVTATPGTAAAPTDPISLAKKYFPNLGGQDGKGLAALTAEGTWLRSGVRYLISFEQGGKKDVRDSGINEAGRLEIPLSELKLSLFFVPAQ
jgi:hypothetical protein